MNGGDNVLSITENFVLPVLVSYGTDKTASLVWSEQSDPDNNVALSGSGNRNVTVIRSSTDKTVTLRAAITAEGVTATKDIDFTILAATTGIISGSATWDYVNTSDNTQYLEGVVVTAADNISMAPLAGTDTTNHSGVFSFDVEPGNYYVSFNFAGVVFPDLYNSFPVYRAHINADTVADGAAVVEESKVDGNENHLRSLTTYSVSTGVTTTVNFTVEGY